jgi:hypothetical protein
MGVVNPIIKLGVQKQDGNFYTNFATMTFLKTQNRVVVHNQPGGMRKVHNTQT